jgi:hypothetical protein
MDWRADLDPLSEPGRDFDSTFADDPGFADSGRDSDSISRDGAR